MKSTGISTRLTAEGPFGPSKVAAHLSDTLWRTLQTFNLSRLLFVGVLLAYLGLSIKHGTAADISALQVVGGAYLTWALGCVALAARWQHGLTGQLLLQLTLDIVFISALYLMADPGRSELAVFYLFPLTAGAVLAPRIPALFFAALASLVLLGEGGYRFWRFAQDAPLMQAGIYGATFFASVLLINRLAAGLIWQEQLASERGESLQVQQAINRLVIADMRDGVLVVSPDGRLETANPAARRMLGLAPSADLTQVHEDIDALPSVADAYADWLVRLKAGQGGAPVAASVFVMLRSRGPSASGTGLAMPLQSAAPLHLKLRFARLEASVLQPGRTLVFIQDVSEIENQAQQLKLASMGRLTASIAHEVRNPLSAIAHAASLLREEEQGQVAMRLLKIVGDNVQRLDRMVEDILRLSRKAQLPAIPLVLAPALEQIVAEFVAEAGIDPARVRIVSDRPGARARFDPLHLREVLINLLGNAVRYASQQAGSIRVLVEGDEQGQLELHVQDDGPTITPQVRDHLFEPFYTTSHKGTGLGLYLARELCLNNGARLDYEYRADLPSAAASKAVGGRFVITFFASGPLPA